MPRRIPAPHPLVPFRPGSLAFHEARMTDSPPEPAYVYASRGDWPGYYRAMAGTPARETLLAALDRFEREARPGVAASAPGFAIDLGCGEGRDTAELLRRGWRVLAIDGHPDALRLIRERTDIAPGAPLETELASYQSAMLPECDLLNASFALPFCPPGAFAGVWAKIVRSIRPGGRFAGQLFGDRDTWADLPDRSHQTRAEAEALFGGFTLEEFREEERDASDALGTAKHWHVFHIIAKREGSEAQGSSESP